MQAQGPPAGNIPAGYTCFRRVGRCAKGCAAGRLLWVVYTCKVRVVPYITGRVRCRPRLAFRVSGAARGLAVVVNRDHAAVMVNGDHGGGHRHWWHRPRLRRQLAWWRLVVHSWCPGKTPHYMTWHRHRWPSGHRFIWRC